jgi:zinc protease
MRRALFGEAPYGAIASQTSIAAVTRDELASFHSTYWRPDNAILVIAGDVSPEEGFQLAERYFGDWVRPSTALPARPDASAHAAGVRAIVVDLPDTGQAAVSMGLRGIARTDADYFPLLVANDVLGGGYSARLNAEIRIRRGLSYGAGSSLQARVAPGPIVATAQTRNDAAVQVYELMRTEIDRIGDQLVPESELTARKASLIGDFGQSVETTSGLAGQISALALYGLPPERLGTYVSDVSAVTAEQARAAAARYFDPARADVVIVGDADTFYDQFRRVRRDAERIPAADLNLDEESLR